LERQLEKVVEERGMKGGGINVKMKKIDFKNVNFQEFSDRVQQNSILLPSEIDSSHLFKSLKIFLHTIRILVDPEFLDLLHIKIKNLKIPNSMLSSSQSICLLNDWYHSSHPISDLRSRIMKTIQEFEVFKSNPLSMDERSSLDSLVFSLKNELTKAPSKSTSSENIIEKSRQGLCEIFSHYAKQQFLLGKNPTFDLIQKNLQVLNQAKFLKFCKDFEIAQINPTERQERKRVKKVAELFKKHSDFNKDMHEHQFFAALEDVSGFFIDLEYDKKHATNWRNLPVSEKIKKFFELMGFHDPGIYLKKMKDLGSHFGVDHTRLPENDLSKKYKHDSEKFKRMKANVEQWKLQKISEKKTSEKKSQERQRTKKSLRKLDCYSSRFQSSHRKTIKSIKDERSELEESKPFTIQSLQSLKMEDLSKLDKDFYIKDLVPEEDEFINEYLENRATSTRARLTKSMSEVSLAPITNFPQIIKRSDNQLSKFSLKKFK
jgi:hypothetical protein